MLKNKKVLMLLAAIIMIVAINRHFLFAAEASEQTNDLECQTYEFNEKKPYPIDSTSPIDNSNEKLWIGTLSITGNINKTYEKDGYTAYEIEDDEIFSLNFDYINTLKKVGEDDWHLIKDGDNEVNGKELNEDVDFGALILQTSFDGKKWINIKSYYNITDDKNYDSEQINNIQLANGCYYRIIAAFKVEKRIDEKLGPDEYEKKRVAQVYTFYASYKDTDTTPTGEKYYFYAGAKNSKYTVKTKENNYAGSLKIDNEDPHYGWDLGYFCLSGYTDKGDSDDIYLKKVGNKVKLTFHLDQDIYSLNGNKELKIVSDKDGSDEEFKVLPHNMKHGELIIRHTDSENNTREVNYSDYLAALAYVGADTSIQLFEEGDYEVHLDYAIVDEDGIDSTTYYQTSFKFKIRNANCMVYIFDSESGAELSNGDVTENGFRIDTAKSSYPKLQVKKEIMNNTKSGLVEDTRFNGAASDGEVFTDEGIYTIKAFNRYDEKLDPAVKTIYIGSDNILTAYTRHLDTAEEYTIEQLNNMIEEGYTITEKGEIIKPVEITATPTLVPKTEKKTDEKVTTTVNPTVSAAPDSSESETKTTKDANKNKSSKSSSFIFVLIGIGAASVIAILRKKNNNDQGGQS